MTYKVGAKGQVVLPKAVREQLGIEPGDEVTIEAREGEAHVRKIQRSREEIIASLMGALADPDDDGPSATELLERERRLDRIREDRKLGLEP